MPLWARHHQSSHFIPQESRKVVLLPFLIAYKMVQKSPSSINDAERQDVSIVLADMGEASDCAVPQG